MEFLYDSGLSVGRSTASEGFKALEALPKSDATDAPSSSASKVGSCHFFFCVGFFYFYSKSLFFFVCVSELMIYGFDCAAAGGECSWGII